MDYSAIIQSIQQGNFSPVYFLQGDEPFFIDNIIEHLEENVVESSQRDFNQFIFYGKEIDFPSLISTARKFPMMGERQLVIVKEAQEIKGWNNETNQSILTEYLKQPSPSTVLAFGYKYKSLDKRTKLAKAFQQEAIVLTSKKIYDNQIPDWIQGYVKAKHVQISPKAVRLLSENIGNNLQRLSNEIEKLLLNIPENQPIDEQAVHRYVGISRDYNTFELQAALGSGNHLKAQKIVKYFAANPSSHPLVLTIYNLYSYFSKLLMIHQSPRKDKQTVAQAIGVHPFFAEEYIRAIRLYPQAKVLSNLQYLHEADLASKGIGQLVPADGDLLKELIFKLMN